MSMQQFANSLYDNGVNPSGAIELDNVMKPEARQALMENFQRSWGGSRNAAKALILDGGMKWKQISINPEDAEFLDSRRFTVEELARLFGVPPPVIGDLTNGTFTNSETVLRWFAQATLSYWIRKVESEFQRSVFTNGTRRLEIDLSGLLRGAPQERWAAWKIAVDARILDPDEVRAEEGFNPRQPSLAG
jgi:HK97 family phage portal protein